MLRYIGLILLMSGFIRPATAAPADLRILAWEGYADPEIQREFSQRFKIKLEVTVVYSDDELWSRANNTQRHAYDLIAVNTAELQRYIDKGLVRPVEVTRIPNIKHQASRFQAREQIPGLVHHDASYGIPYAFSAMGLIYNRRLVSSPPGSIKSLWDPRYQGQVLAFNTSNHSFTLAGLSLGFADPFHQSAEQLRASARHLVQLRRNILTFYNTPDEVVSLFKSNQIALIYANYGTQQLKALEDVGADVGYTLPDDGTLAWLDCWAIGAGAGPLAEQWINFTLEQSQSQRLTSNHGLANTLSDADLYQRAHIIWLEPVENAELRNSLWDKIFAGDSMEKF